MMLFSIDTLMARMVNVFDLYYRCLAPVAYGRLADKVGLGRGLK